MVLRAIIMKNVKVPQTETLQKVANVVAKLQYPRKDKYDNYQ